MASAPAARPEVGRRCSAGAPEVVVGREHRASTWPALARMGRVALSRWSWRRLAAPPACCSRCGRAMRFSRSARCSWGAHRREAGCSATFLLIAPRPRADRTATVVDRDDGLLFAQGDLVRLARHAMTAAVVSAVLTGTTIAATAAPSRDPQARSPRSTRVDKSVVVQSSSQELLSNGSAATSLAGWAAYSSAKSTSMRRLSGVSGPFSATTADPTSPRTGRWRCGP